MKRESWEITSRWEWLQRRQSDMTASRVAALFSNDAGQSVHPYMSRNQLAAAMRGHSQGSTPAMRAGRILEPGVIVALAEEHPDWCMRKATTYHRLPDHRLGATPDYWLDDDGLIECKTVSPEVWDKWGGHPPLGYKLQLLAGMMCTGRERGVLAVMIRSPSYPVHEFAVPRHEGAEQRILDAVAEWWRAWDAGEIAGPAPAAEIAAALDDGSHKDLSGDNAIRGLLEEHCRLSAAMGAAKKELGAIDHQIKTRIGLARTAYVPGYSISFKSQQRKETVIPAATIRVLRVKAISEEVE